MKYIRQGIFITLIVLLGAFLRFNKLDKIPGGFYVDEAAIGYNAYSFLLTGKDEYSKAFPIFLRSFGAFSSPLYTYLTTVPIAILGPTIFSTRLLSALCGTLSILVIFLIFKRINLFRNKYTSYLSVLLYAISPWSIFFSRGAYEANLALLFVISAIYFLLDKKRRLFSFCLAAIFLSLSTYAYQAERLIVYILYPGYLFFFVVERKLKKMFDKKIIISLFIFFAIQIPQLVLLQSPAFRNRAVGLFYGDVIKIQADKIVSVIPRQITYGLAFAKEFFSQFFAYFSPRNLFLDGDPDMQRGIPLLSVFYQWMMFPYLLGFYILLSNIRKKEMQFIIFLMVSFAIVPSLTKDPFSTLRSLPLLLPFTLIISLGVDRLLSFIPKVTNVLIFVILIIFSLISLWRSYFVLLPRERAKVWGYGFDQLVKEIETRPSDTFLIDQSRIKPVYIELAFFLRYPPQKFQEAVNQTIKNNYYGNTVFSDKYNFANIETGTLNWEKDIYRNLIIVGDELAISSQQAEEHYLTQVFEIKDPIGYVIFKAYKTNPLLKCASEKIKSLYCTYEK